MYINYSYYVADMCIIDDEMLSAVRFTKRI